jgi:hypothetical protein
MWSDLAFVETCKVEKSPSQSVKSSHMSSSNTNSTNNTNSNNEFYWDNVLDESFIRGFIDEKGEVIT